MIEKLKEVNGRFEAPDGISYEDRRSYLQTDILGFCGCGVPDEIMLYVKAFLEKVKAHDFAPYEDLPYMFLCYWADDKGFVEHGTTVRCPWLTELGEELLKDINTVIEIEGVLE